MNHRELKINEHGLTAHFDPDRDFCQFSHSRFDRNIASSKKREEGHSHSTRNVDWQYLSCFDRRGDSIMS